MLPTRLPRGARSFTLPGLKLRDSPPVKHRPRCNKKQTGTQHFPLRPSRTFPPVNCFFYVGHILSRRLDFLLTEPPSHLSMQSLMSSLTDHRPQRTSHLASEQKLKGTLRASHSGTFLQTLPDGLVTPLMEHSLSPRSCPPTRYEASSKRFGPWQTPSTGLRHPSFNHCRI